MLADVNCIANKLAGAKLRIYLDIKSKYLDRYLDRFHLREKKVCDVQNMVTTVIIRVGRDALWGHLARGDFTPQTRFGKKKIIMKLIIFSLKCSF